jgi:hypothetical protein
MKEMDEFDKLFKTKEKRIGFPNASLSQMKMKTHKPPSISE